MRNILALLAFLLAIVIAGGMDHSRELAESNLDRSLRVRVEADCPTEDSCYADYYNGAWYIVEDVP